VDLIEAHGGRGHIPTQRDRKVQRSVDPAIYRQRNLIERFFNKLKHFRKIATRYEKTARNYLAAVLIASSRLWMRHYESAS
jgi:transposase